MNKTMVMKILDQKHINYKHYIYDASLTDANLVASALNENPLQVFKTLVTKGEKKYYVFMVPANATLDLKKCAKQINEKSVEMIKQKELYPLTGYVHGGCSPIGMKKSFPTFIDLSANNFDSIIFSAGLKGMQVEVKVEDLTSLIKATFLDLTKE